MAGFFTELMERPATASTRLSRYTERCGYFYGLLGLSFLLFPSGQAQLGLLAPFEGQEEAMMRIIGFVLCLIGYFYVFGGRTQQTSFGLATVLDRLLVPFVFLFIYQVSEVELMLILPIAIMDPLLGLGAYACWRKDQQQSP